MSHSFRPTFETPRVGDVAPQRCFAYIPEIIADNGVVVRDAYWESCSESVARAHGYQFRWAPYNPGLMRRWDRERREDLRAGHVEDF